MRVDIWCGFDEVPADIAQTVVTIGVFDGMHRGHQKLLAAASTCAAKLQVPSVLLTFDPHPLAVLRPDKMPPMLGTLQQRAALAAVHGTDHVLAMSFNAEISRLSPEEFFTEILLDRLHAQAVVVGENFAFGYKASGTTTTLMELGEKYGVEIHVIDMLVDDNEVICSTLIRSLLREGDVRRANWALGRWFRVTGEVVRGAGRGGKELGFPTANLYFPDSVALPKDAVYAGWLTIDSAAPIDGDMERGVRYPAAISVGHNPTFGDVRRSVEAYVIDREVDLYGHTVTIEFVDHVRDMEKFESVSDLLAAINHDVHKTLQLLEKENV